MDGIGARRVVILGRAVVFALALLPLAACFEHPIDEELEIRFLPTRAVVVSSRTVLVQGDKDEEAANGNDEAAKATAAKLAIRLADARSDLERGEDYWSRQFAAIPSRTGRVVEDRVQGALTQSIRRVYMKDPEDVRAILARSAGSVTMAHGEGWDELMLHPLPGARASEAQRRRGSELIAEWAARVSQYLERTGKLYRYLDAHPERAEICLTPLIGPAENMFWTQAPEPTEEESALIGPVNESMKSIAEMFEFKDGSGWEPDEIVHLATDPFPSRLVVRVPGRVVESEGFVTEKAGRLMVPEGGLFGAIASIEGTWIAPDPLVTSIRSLRGSDPVPVDVAAFAALPRVARGGATAAAVRRALEKGIAPAPVYRVRWAVAERPAGEEIPDSPDWDALAAPDAPSGRRG